MSAEIAADFLRAPSSCPFCGNLIDLCSATELETTGSCSVCQSQWHKDGRTVLWKNATDSQSTDLTTQAENRSLLARLRKALAKPSLFRDFFLAKLSNFHPLKGKNSPLQWLTKRKLDIYYSRTLNDPGLGKQWRDGFLKGLQLPTNPTLLDHGCGRGRMIALARQNGCTVCAQDIAPDPWWSKLEFAAAQVVPPDARQLPWPDDTFNIVLNVGVIGHFKAEQLGELASEVRRVLVKGGYWIILEANSEGFGASGPRQHYGRLHSLKEVSALSDAAGFRVVDVDYEGFQPPILPKTITFLTRIAWPGKLNLTNRDSLVVRMLPPHRRYLWRLRLQST